jgi:DNA-binding transcriptional LysR family regulator
MLIRHLAYFVALAREQHFARAAAACHVAQPTLSAAIHKLEEELDVSLVVRDHRFIGLTAEGKTLLTWAQKILTDHQSLRDDLAGAEGKFTGTLRLGIVPAAMPVVAFVTNCFVGANPAAGVNIRSMTSREIQRALDAFEIDAGMTYLENEPLEHVRRLPLYTERYLLVVNRDHPRASRRTISWRAAFGERLCLLSDDMQNRRIINAVAASIGIAVEPALTANSFLALLSHLRHGGWASIVPHTFFDLVAETDGLVPIRLVEPTHSQLLGLVLSDRDPESPAARSLRTAVIAADLEADLRERFSRPD